jgi:MoaA/NifB/PqqE/SkfB family radical SAM enzyme
MENKMQNYFDLKVGFTCNNRCIHCVIDSKKATPDYSTEQIKSIIDTVPRGHTVGFTGGEASIRMDFIELCKYAKATGHGVALQSNGVRFSDKSFTKEVSQYLDNVLLAIHSHIPEVHDAIVQQKGMHRRTIAGFYNIIESGISVSTQTVISKLNMETLSDTYSWIQEQAPGIWMSMTYPHPNGAAWYNRDTVCPSYSELQPFLHDALERWAPQLRTEAIPFCYLYPYHNKVGFNFDAEVLSDEATLVRAGIDPANVSATKDLFDSSGRIDDYRKADRQERYKGPLCKDCVFNDKCPGVWKEYIAMYASELDLYPIEAADQPSETCDDCSNDQPQLLPVAAVILSSDIQCSNTCVFCSGSPIGIPDEESYKTALASAKWFISQGFTQFEISGADPTENRYVLDLIKYLRDNGAVSIQLSSHGRLLANLAIAEQYKLAGVTKVRFPIYGVTPEMHNTVAQCKNLSDPLPFQEVVQALINCSALDITICPQTVISQSNKDHLVDIFDIYDKISLGNRTTPTLGLIYISEMDYKYTGTWYIPMKDLKPYLNKVLDSINDILLLDIPYCSVGHYDDRIHNPNIDELILQMGNQRVSANVRSKKRESIPFYREKEYWSECFTCCLQNNCGGWIRNDMQMFGTYGITAVKED